MKESSQYKETMALLHKLSSFGKVTVKIETSENTISSTDPRRWKFTEISPAIAEKD